MQATTTKHPDQVMQYLTDAETAAESVISDKAQIIELDRTRNKVREAARHVRKTNDTKTWVCVGGTFMKMPTKTVAKVLTHDLDELDNDIGKLRSGLKGKVDRLRDVESKDELRGFNLNPLSKEEMRSLENIL